MGEKLPIMDAPKSAPPPPLTTGDIRKIVSEEIIAALKAANFASSERVDAIEYENGKLKKKLEQVEARAASAAQTAIDTAQKVEKLANTIEGFGAILKASQEAMRNSQITIESLFKAYLPRIDDLVSSVEKLEERDDVLQANITKNTLMITERAELVNANIAQMQNALAINTRVIFGDKDLPNAQKSILLTLQELTEVQTSMARALDLVGSYTETINDKILGLEQEFERYRGRWLKLLKAGVSFVAGRSKSQVAGTGISILSGGGLAVAIYEFIVSKL